MRKFLYIIGIFLGFLVGLIAIAVLALYVITEEKLRKSYDIQVENIPVASDPASIERGEHLVRALGFCSDCHGDNLAGQVFDDGPLIGRLTVSNLTSGKGGIGGTFSDADWIRAIRHGVGPDKQPLVDMPSDFYYNLNDADLGAIIAYLKNLPPIDNELPEKQIGFMARWYILQEPSLLPAQVIDHNAPRPPSPEPGVTVEYGRYLATMCSLCHGEDLAGGPEPGAGLNLTPVSDLASWTEEDFIRTIRTGVNPKGKQLNPELMPWKRIGEMSDDDLKAIFAYLKTLPPVESPVMGETENAQ